MAAAVPACPCIYPVFLCALGCLVQREAGANSGKETETKLSDMKGAKGAFSPTLINQSISRWEITQYKYFITVFKEIFSGNCIFTWVFLSRTNVYIYSQHLYIINLCLFVVSLCLLLLCFQDTNSVKINSLMIYYSFCCFKWSHLNRTTLCCSVVQCKSESYLRGRLF